MRRKYIKIWIFALCTMFLMVSLSGCGADKNEADKGKSEKKVALKITLAGNEQSPMYAGASKFAELLKEKSDGRITGTVYANSSLASGNQQKAIEMIQKGTIDVGWVAMIAQSPITPKLGVLAVPWVWDNHQQSDTAFTPGAPVFAWYEKALRESNFQILGFAENGNRQITNSKKPIRTPEDFKNLKMRVLADPVLLDVYRKLGANVVDINFGELFTALQQGTVDGQENPIATIMVPGRYYEVQKYLTIWGGPYEPLLVEMNAQKWDGLSEADQKIVQECADEAVAYERKLSRDATEKGIQLFKDKGCEVTILNDKEIMTIKNEVKDVINQYMATYDPEIVKLIEEAKK